MPKTVEELEKMFSETNDRVEQMKKDFELKLESKDRDVQHFKKIAEERTEELRVYDERVKKENQDRAEAVAKAKEADIREYVESKVKAGVILPANRDKIAEFMKSLNGEKIVSEFTEADGKKVSHNQISLFKEILGMAGTKVQVEREISFAGSNGPEKIDDDSEQGETQFATIRHNGAKEKLPMADVDLHVKVLEYQEKNKGVSYGDALIAVSSKRAAV